jgi:hypothetical protein
MRKLLFISVVMLAGCGGKLSDEQRKKMKDEMNKHKIVQISDSEIVSSALDQGRRIFSILEKLEGDSSRVDSLASANHIKISWVTPGSSKAAVLEQQLIDAYVSGLVTGSLQDNIQKIHNADNPGAYDSLVYSKPVVTPMPDGVENLEGVWNIYLSKKQVILASGK